MKIENGKIVLGRKDCFHCQEGTVPARIPCTVCNATGKGPRGKVGGCKTCFGSGKSWDSSIRKTCKHCNGNYKEAEPETDCDYLPHSEWETLTFKVYRGNGPNIIESLTGIGIVYTSADYGRAWESPDDSIIAKVRANRHHQACKVCDKELNVCDHIGIYVGRNGYTVKPVFLK